MILIPILGGIISWASGKASPMYARWVALVTLIIHMVIMAAFWIANPPASFTPGQTAWIQEVSVPWISGLGISYHLGIDGLSLLLGILTSFLGIIAVLASWDEIQERASLFYFMLLWTLGAIMGVFLSLDLFLFYFFWEMTLIPLYFIIGIWGHENRIYATLKFFIFTQASSLFMLISILGLYFINGHTTGTYTFDYNTLIRANPGGALGFWLSLGFFLAFITKLPAFPVHPWLPDAHTEAPTAGSVILAGLLLKLGGYGLLRFSVPLFPSSSFSISTVAMILGVISIIYGAIQAFGQKDFKRLVAYTSVSHMGFVLIGIYSWNQYALQGAVIVMLAHGVSTGALFVIAGMLQDRMHTRQMDRMGGLWDTVPYMGGTTLLFALASLGLPGLGNFIGEFLVLLGAFQANVTLAVLATLGFVVSTVYSLWLIQRSFQGPNHNHWKLPDLSIREVIMLGSLAVAIFWLGLYPQSFINTARPAINALQQATHSQQSAQSSSPQAQVAVEKVNLIDGGARR
jgi:NADH-quinone oxidoreductase subunit M